MAASGPNGFGRREALGFPAFKDGEFFCGWRDGTPLGWGMCGKFTAMASWSEVVDFSEALTSSSEGSGGDNDREVGFRVMGQLNVIIWDAERRARRTVPMRWGFPRRGNWRSPDPIHARSETIDSKPTFAPAFVNAQRGIVLVKTFNELMQVSKSVAEQYTITLGDDRAGAIAVLFDRFDIAELPAPLLACVMVTVPANELIRTLSTEHAEADRMPAFLAKDAWETWLGQNAATPADAKTCLQTVEGINWKMTKEERGASKKARRTKPTVSDPGGLF
jgi:putative SOS response-associated peptidase YedK